MFSESKEYTIDYLDTEVFDKRCELDAKVTGYPVCLRQSGESQGQRRAYTFIVGGSVTSSTMAPSYMRRADDAPEIDEDIKTELLEQIEEARAKPWTIVSRTSNELDRDPDEVRKVLRQLTQEGEITPTADGDLRKAHAKV